MTKDEQIIFTKYGQLYEGTFQGGEGNKVKVASLSGGVHTVDASNVQTKEAYQASKQKETTDVE